MMVLCSIDSVELARNTMKLAGLDITQLWVFDSVLDEDGGECPRPVLYPVESESTLKPVRDCGKAYDCASVRTACDYGSQEPLPSWSRITDPEELANTPLCLLFTSGTTSPTGYGHPLLISQQNMVAQAVSTTQLMRPSYREWASMPVCESIATEKEPYFHFRAICHTSFAHIACIQMYCINGHHDAGIIYWMRVFDFETLIKHCTKLRVSHFYTVVPIYLAIARLPKSKARAAFAHTKIAFSAGAHLPVIVHRDLEQRMGTKVGGCHFSSIYGATEATGAITWSVQINARHLLLGSVGELIPNVELRYKCDVVFLSAEIEPSGIA